MTRKSKGMICALAVAAGCFVAAGMMGLSAVAETPISIENLNFAMANGASIRYGAADGHNGIRFAAVMPKSDYRWLTENTGEGKTYGEVSFGMLIAPLDLLSTDLTVETVFGENAEFYWTETGREGQKKIVNIPVAELGVSDLYPDSYVAFGSVTDVLEKNLTREMVGRGYIKYTLSSDAGGVCRYLMADYARDDRTNNTRSMTYVAQKAIEATETGEAATAHLKAEYVDKTADVASSYTVNIRKTDKSGKSAIVSSETVKSKVGAPVTFAEKNFLGYAEEKTETKTVYANDKLVVERNFRYDGSEVVAGYEDNDGSFIPHNEQVGWNVLPDLAAVTDEKAHSGSKSLYVPLKKDCWYNTFNPFDGVAPEGATKLRFWLYVESTEGLTNYYFDTNAQYTPFTVYTEVDGYLTHYFENCGYSGCWSLITCDVPASRNLSDLKFRFQNFWGAYLDSGGAPTADGQLKLYLDDVMFETEHEYPVIADYEFSADLFRPRWAGDGTLAAPKQNGIGRISNDYSHNGASSLKLSNAGTWLTVSPFGEKDAKGATKIGFWAYVPYLMNGAKVPGTYTLKINGTTDFSAWYVGADGGEIAANRDDKTGGLNHLNEWVRIEYNLNGESVYGLALTLEGLWANGVHKTDEVSVYIDDVVFISPDDIATDYGSYVPVAGMSADQVVSFTGTGLGESVAYPPSTGGVTYYVSASDGDENNGGTSAQTPFNSLSQVNELLLQGGDKVLFKAGDEFSGTLRITQSGADGNPIYYGTYGEGAKARIHMEYRGGEWTNAVYFADVSNIVIENLELTMTAPEKSRDSESAPSILAGIYTRGNFRNVWILNNEIHGNGVGSLLNGITFNSEFDSTGDSAAVPDLLTDVHIKGNTVYGVGIVGISVTAWFKDLGHVSTRTDVYSRIYVEKNTVYDVGQIGAYLSCCNQSTLNRNLVYRCGMDERGFLSVGDCGLMTLSCRDCEMSYNEVYGCERAGQEYDGMGIDIDWNCSFITVRYNYCHDNAGSGIGTMANSDCLISDNRIENNRCEGNQKGQLQVSDFTAVSEALNEEAYAVKNLVIRNNLIINNVPGAPAFSVRSLKPDALASTVWSGNVFTGNRIVDNSDSPAPQYVITEANTAWQTFTENRYYSDVADFFGCIDNTPSAEVGGGATALENGNYTRFSDWQQRDLQAVLKPLSSAAPSAAENLRVHFSDGKLSLMWNASKGDVWQYGVYLTAAGEEPSAENLLGTVHEEKFEYDWTLGGTFYLVVRPESVRGVYGKAVKMEITFAV